MQAQDGVEGLIEDTPASPQGVAGEGVEDEAGPDRVRFLDAGGGEGAEQVRVLALDDGDLFGGAFGDGQQVAPGQVGAEEGGQPLALVLALADLPKT